MEPRKLYNYVNKKMITRNCDIANNDDVIIKIKRRKKRKIALLQIAIPASLRDFNFKR